VDLLRSKVAYPPHQTSMYIFAAPTAPALCRGVLNVGPTDLFDGVSTVHPLDLLDLQVLRYG
jgi:hypothetical protein